MPLAPSTLAALRRALLSARASVSDAWFAANALGDRDSQERLRSANELLVTQLALLEVMMSPVMRAQISPGQNLVEKS